MNMHGDCATHPCAWHCLLHHERWPEVVNRVFYVESILDKEVVDSNTELGFVCALCNPLCKFATSRALQSHQRSKHKNLNPIRCYIDASAKCPSCATQFGSRISMLAHVSDSRRPKCRDYVFENCPVLEPALVQELDAKDNLQRKAARRAGRSHHIVVAPAVNSCGRIVGRASQ